MSWISDSSTSHRDTPVHWASNVAGRPAGNLARSHVIGWVSFVEFNTTAAWITDQLYQLDQNVLQCLPYWWILKADQAFQREYAVIKVPGHSIGFKAARPLSGSVNQETIFLFVWAPCLSDDRFLMQDL